MSNYVKVEYTYMIYCTVHTVQSIHISLIWVAFCKLGHRNPFLALVCGIFSSILHVFCLHIDISKKQLTHFSTVLQPVPCCSQVLLYRKLTAADCSWRKASLPRIAAFPSPAIFTTQGYIIKKLSNGRLRQLSPCFQYKQGCLRPRKKGRIARGFKSVYSTVDV